MVLNVSSSSAAAAAAVLYNLADANLGTLETVVFLSAIVPLIVFTVSANAVVIYVMSADPALKVPSNLVCYDLLLLYHIII